MANKSDGSIIIDTALDNSGFTKGAAKMERAMQHLVRETERVGSVMQKGFSTPKQMDSFQSKIDNVKASIAQLESQLNELSQQTISTVEYENVSKAIEKAEKALFKLYDRRDIMQELGVKESSVQWRRLQIQIQNAEEELERYEQAKASMEASGQAFVSGAETEEYQRLSAAISETAARLDEYQAAKQRAQDGGGEKVSGFRAALERVGSTAKTVAVNLGKVAWKKFTAGVKGAVSWLKQFISHGDKSVLSAKGLIKSLTSLKTMLFSRVKRMFISNIFNEMKESLTLLQRYSKSFGAAMNNMKNSAKMLSSNLAIAFGNLITAIEPIITRIINAVSRAITYLNAFFAMLSGKSTMTVAKKQMKDYTNETDKAANATQALVKQLRSFDEINRLNAPDDKSDDGGTKPEDLFEEVPISSILPASVRDFFLQLKAAFEAGDWGKIGEIIAGGLNRAMAAIDDWIINVFRSLAATWAERIATTLNHFIAAYDWALLGKTVADGISAGVNAWWKFATTFDFGALGTRIAAAINSFLSTMSIPDETGLNVWQKLGQALSRTVNGLLTAINNALQNVDWFKVGQAIGDFISSIDWGAITWNFAKMAGGIIKGIGEAIAGWADTSPISMALATVLTTAFAGVKLGPIITAAMFANSLKNGALGAGGATGGTISGLAGAAAGAASKVATALTGVGSMVSGIVIAVSNFFSMLKNGFNWVKEILMVVGTALAAVGAIILGAPALITGVIAAIVAAVATAVVVIKDNWEAICGWFEELPDKIMQGWDNFTKGLETGWADFSSGFMSDMDRFGSWLGSVWQGLIDGIVADWNGLVDGAMAIWTETKLQFSDAVTSIKEGLSSGWEAMKESATSAWEAIKTSVTGKFTATREKLESGISAVSTSLSSGWENVKSNTSSLWEATRSSVTSIFSSMQSKLNGSMSALMSALSGGWNSIQATASSMWSSISSAVMAKWNGLRSTMRNTDWKSIGANLCRGIADGINDGWQWLKTTVGDLCSRMKSKAESDLKIHSPSRVFRDDIGKNVGLGLAEGISDTKRDVATSVSNLAKTAVDAFGNPTLSADVASVEMISGLDMVAEKLSAIVGSFQAIASVLETMGGLLTPDIAVGTVIPPKVRTAAVEPGSVPDNTSSDVSSKLDMIADYMIQGFEAIVKSIDEKDTSVSIGDEDIWNANNRFKSKMDMIRGTV